MKQVFMMRSRQTAQGKFNYGFVESKRRELTPKAFSAKRVSVGVSSCRSHSMNPI